MASEQAPTHITYNPVYMATYEGSDPTRGYVYVLETARPTPVTPVSSQGIVISNRFYEHLIALTGYHITRPPTPDHEFVNVCNGDLRKLSDFMDTVAPVSPDAIGKCGELANVAWLHPTAGWAHHKASEISIHCSTGQYPEALVTRSQAEELLAAVTKERDFWKDRFQSDTEAIRKLETKLAAAEKALTEIASFTQTTDLLWWQERARAALGGKPS
ncbi:hypothetical protein [Brucella intermedia]|uniref:hypothetical protein n=1 Tax=Brucella intermedia TaxID=94625 RepID=UPI00124C5775|nr:hypothetical protein [Brucella intermedia]KAB2716624.1 hypothetical protein F9K75_11040 [Brucella intermedia]